MLPKISHVSFRADLFLAINQESARSQSVPIVRERPTQENSFIKPVNAMRYVGWLVPTFE